MTPGSTTPPVLAATDFSETATTGVEWAAAQARARNTTLALVHGLLLPNRMADFLPSPPDLTEELQAAAVSRLEEVAQELRERGLEVLPEVRLGLPSEAILEAIAEHRPSLAVLGTRGHTGLGHLLLGSTAERVVQHADCPVLTVHPGDAERHPRIRSILVPTDFSADSERALAPALELLSEGRGKLILLHVFHLPFEYTAYGTIPTTLNYQHDAGADAESRLAELAESAAREGLQVETVAREGYPPEAIVEEAESRDVDLIALGTHGRSGLAHLLLGSTARRVVQRAGCPVLTVRRPAVD